MGPSAPALHPGMVEELGELPEAYGTRRLFLTARDPHWLYAHWDFSSGQLRECNALSADRHLVLRVLAQAPAVALAAEVHVHPESRNWFVHVGRGGARYSAELGYYRKPDRTWVSVARSEATLTPPDALAAEAEVHYATIPFEVPFATLVAIVQEAAKENVPLAEAILQLRATGHPGIPLPALTDWPVMDWTPEREQALAEAVAQAVSMDSVRRVWIGSLEITELLRRKLAEQQGSAAAAEFGLPGAAPGGVASVSSPFGGAPSARGFWFNINAELIIYGATEPDASVTIADRPVRLRPDGSFSFRFALPDGRYELPAVALSADGVDLRAAALTFSRGTRFTGEVMAHPQDAALKPPHPEHLA